MKPRGIGLGLDGVAHTRAGRPVLDIASLAIAPGEAVAIVGPNGAGKSTLLAILAGLEAPARGAARIGGLPATRLEARRRIALVPQDAPLLEGTVAANVERPLALRGIGARERRWRAGVVLESMGLGGLRNGTPRRSRGARRGGSLWRARWRPSPRRCCSTSPSPASTIRRASGWSPRSAPAFAQRNARWCW